MWEVIRTEVEQRLGIGEEVRVEGLLSRTWRRKQPGVLLEGQQYGEVRKEGGAVQ